MIYMNNYSNFYTMISKSRYVKKYHTGKEIKTIIKKCLSNKITLDISRRKQVEEFNNKYIQCKYPLVDEQLYYLYWVGKDIKCFEKYEVVY